MLNIVFYNYCNNEYAIFLILFLNINISSLIILDAIIVKLSSLATNIGSNKLGIIIGL